jgi:hypothetical protein
MKLDKGTLFFAFTGMVLIILIVALAAVVVTNPPSSPTADSDPGPLLGSTGGLPEMASPAVKNPNYPGISTKYVMDGHQRIGIVQGYMAGNPVYGRDLTLNDNGTISMTISNTYGQLTGGHWYKVEGKGHTIYLAISGTFRVSELFITLDGIAGTAEIVNRDGVDYFYINNIGCTGGSYSDWDAGYATMSLPVSSLGLYLDSCIPADVARPYVEKGFTGEQGVPYMSYNVPPDTADYFAKYGITGDLCGPYYTAGVSPEDTVDYLDSGFTADQIMPYVRAKVLESDALAYLNAGVIYDQAKPYIDANASASAAAPYAASTFPADQCVPFVTAGIEISKARPFLLFGIPSDQAIVYINNGITASTAKPYVNAGVPADKAVDEIKQGLAPTV